MRGAVEAVCRMQQQQHLRALFARVNPRLDPSPELARVDVLHCNMWTMLRSTVVVMKSSLYDSSPAGGTIRLLTAMSALDEDL